MLEVIPIFIYPDNLTAKPTLWLWELKDLAVVGVGLFFFPLPVLPLILPQLTLERRK